MTPSQFIRLLRPACIVAGLPEPSPADDADHDDAVDLLSQLIDAVDRDRPGGARRRAAEPIAGSGPDPAIVRQLAEAQRSDPQIAAELGTTATAIRSIRRRHGIAAGGKAGGQRNGWQARVREAHGRGLTVAQIAAELDYTPASVHQYLYVLGLEANPEPRRRGRPKRKG